MAKEIYNIQAEDLSRIIEMAWEDRTPFDAIATLYGFNEDDVIILMRRRLNSKAFKNWRARVGGRVTKHGKLRPSGIERGYCKTQYKIRGNKRK